MAPIKRKGNVPEETATRQPQKRAKVGAEEAKKEKPKDTAAKASELSLLKEEEPSFPRGGGSVLTPLERKKINIQATQDVLFEQKGPKKAPRQTNEDDDDDEDSDAVDEETAAPAKKSKKKSKKAKKSGSAEKSEKASVRIEPLNFKVWWNPSTIRPKNRCLSFPAYRTWVYDPWTSVKNKHTRNCVIFTE